MKNKLLQLFLCLSLSVSAASAQSKKEIEEAKTLFDSATVYYNKKEYEKALVGYQDAYKVAQLPFILFNIAQCYRFLGKSQEAKDAYAKYLLDEPKSEYRAEVEQKIKDLDVKLAEEKRLTEEAKLTEEKRLAEEARIAEEKRRAETAASQAASTQAASLAATQPAPKQTPAWKPLLLPAGGIVAGGGLLLASFGFKNGAINANNNKDVESSSSLFRATQATFITADVLFIASAGVAAYQLLKIKKTKPTETITSAP